MAHGASNGLSNVNVEVSDLTGPNGQVIPRTSFFTVSREVHAGHVVEPQWKGSNQPMAPGWYADALIPFTDPTTGKPPVGGTLKAVPFDLKAGNNQPIWVDLLVPRTAAPGQYKGTYTISSKQGEFKGEIALKVWNFELPVAPSLQSSFCSSRPGLCPPIRNCCATRSRRSPLTRKIRLHWRRTTV